MSRITENPLGIGIAAGLLALCGFGALATLVFDPRFNGDNEAKLQKTLKMQAEELLSVKSRIELQKERAEAISEAKLLAASVAEKEAEVLALTERRSTLLEQVTAARKAIEKSQQDQLDHRDAYRVYERERAAGEKFDVVKLVDGTQLKDVEISRVDPEKVLFKTQYGTKGVTWTELPDDWSIRFQAGAGELEAYAAQRQIERAALAEKAAVINDKRQIAIMEADKKRRVASLQGDLGRLARDKIELQRMAQRAKEERDKWSRFARKASTSGAAAGHKKKVLVYREQEKDCKQRIRLIERKMREVESALKKMSRE